MRIMAWRTSVLIALCAFLASFLLPSLVVLQFTLERERIEHEVCVMRAAAPEANTCHGNCYLIRQLKAAEGRQAHPFEHFQVRTQPAVCEVGEAVMFVLPEAFQLFALHVPRLSAGFHRAMDPVPWC